MERVLLASGSDKGITLLSQLLRESGYNQITNTKSGNDARRCINQTEYELIVINTPLTDEFGHEFSIKAAECSNSGIILICKSDISEDDIRQTQLLWSMRRSETGKQSCFSPVGKTCFCNTFTNAGTSEWKILSYRPK